MFLTQTNMLRGLSKQAYNVLSAMCRYSNSLYNVALYQIRQQYFQEHRFLSYETNCQICKTNENYAMLQAGVSQQILRVADRSFKSFFNLIKKAKSGEYRFQDISMPGYKPKGGMFVLIMQGNAISIKDGLLKLPVSRAFEKQYGKKDIRIPVPDRIANKNIKEIRIIPVGNGTAFKIQYVYEEPCENLDLDPDKWLSIDLGIDNLAACVDYAGTSFLMDGRYLKHINQRYNKQSAYYKAIAYKQGQRQTHRLDRLTLKRQHQIQDTMKKTARYLMDYCIRNGIGTLIVGYNPGMKQRVNIGRVNNQNFVQIPTGYLRDCLQYLCERYGIAYIEQEESYTSQASFKDLDVIPTYNPAQPYTRLFSGQRVHRGLYRNSDGTIINADINGALNIMRKSKQNFDYKGLCEGLLDSPLRIRVS